MSLNAKFDIGAGGVSQMSLNLKGPNLQGGHLVNNHILASSSHLSPADAKTLTSTNLLSNPSCLIPKKYGSSTTASMLCPKASHVDLSNKLLTTSRCSSEANTKYSLEDKQLKGRIDIRGESLLSKYQMNTPMTLTSTLSILHSDPKLVSQLHVVTTPTVLSKQKEKRKVQHETKKKKAKVELHGTNEKAIKKRHSAKKATSKKHAGVVVPDREAILAKYLISQPQHYDVGRHMKVTELQLPKFVPPEKDAMIQMMQRPVHNIVALKRMLINAVCASLIRAPDFKESHDPVRLDLIHVADRVITYDPEFVLKVALYTRNELNIRTTGNFLLTYAAYHHACRSFLQKYFSVSVRLPSDWIEVAEQYQTFRDGNLSKGSLPASLRRAMVKKFPEFDNYQLAKYNKANAIKKRRKKKKKKQVTYNQQSGDQNLEVEQDQDLCTTDSESETSQDEATEEKEVNKESFTLKQLIRKLHITEPVEAVMCLIGKRYPATVEEFYKSQLPGTFDPDRANKRMKLPTPETWETQVSLKGNKASTWEELIDHKKLPYMAMLRNLRNMIKAGISEKHHTWVLKKLADQGAVINSKQFPFRFFSAYEVLRQLEEECVTTQDALINQAVEQKSFSRQSNRTSGRGQGRGRGRGRGNVQRQKQKQPQEILYDVTLLKRYKKALDSAVKIATVHNVQPIRGTTFIFCNTGKNMACPCTSARGLGKPVTVLDVGILLGLMCKYSCEESTMIAYGSADHRQVELEKDTILNNMSRVKELASVLNSDGGKAEIPLSILQDLLVDQTQVDNLIILSDGMTLDSNEGKAVTTFLKKYRRMVNNDLLFVSVDLSGSAPGFAKNIQPGHDNDIYLAGFSDQILRFIAERGDNGQLIHVENIDLAYNLEQVSKQPPETNVGNNQKNTFDYPLTLISQTPRWRMARVFISSTFRDMHGERDLLTRYVFPELRARAQKHFISVREVDLRWGVTEEVTQSKKTLELCLDEVSRCQFFIGLLGERYGWIPDDSCIPKKPELDWISEHPKGASLTELEMYCAALRKPEESREHAFFYIRNNKGYDSIPDELKDDFISENYESRQRINQLKKNIKSSGLEVFDGYPWYWGGVVDNKPIAAGLEAFGSRVLDNLWKAIPKKYPDENVLVDDIAHETAQHEAYLQSHYEVFTGRKKVLKKALSLLQDHASSVIGIVGKPGSGKSALMAAIIHEYVESKHCESGMNVFTHFVGAVPGSTHIVGILRRLCHEMVRRFGIHSEIPEGFKNLVARFAGLLEQCAKCCLTPIVVFLDALEYLDDDYQAQTLEWIQNTLPKNVIFVLSTKEGTPTHRAIERRSDSTIINIGMLELLERADVVRKMLSVHRKQLDESPFNNQMKLLVSKREANSPLYLSVACEELRVFGLFDQLATKLKSMPQTVQQLLQEVFARLEKDYGQKLVGASLGLLSCVRNGLEESELHDLLNYWQLLSDTSFTVHDVHNIQLDVDKMIAPLTLAQLFRALHGVLRPAGVQISQHLAITHTIVRQVAHHRYVKMAGIDCEKKLHQLLAGYYYQLADPDGNGSWKGTCPKAFSELPYHLASAGLFSELQDVLCNLHFIHSKAQLGMVTQLLQDYQAKGSSIKMAKSQQKFLNAKKVMEYQNFVSRNAHLLKSHPSLTWQQALNEATHTSPAADVRQLISSTCLKTDLTLIEWTNKPATSDPCLYTISDLPQVVSCIAVCPDDRFFACGTQDCTVKVYEVQTGKEIISFAGHSGQITDVCFVDNKRLCSASADNTLSLWDLTDRYRIAVLKGHRRKVNAVACDPAGKQLVSVGWDCMIKIWDINTGKSDGELKEGRPINCVCYHPDGQLIATGSWDAAIRIWDTFNKICRAVIRGHLTSVRNVAYSPSGSRIVSAASDGEVKLWSALNGSQTGNFTGHALPINKLYFAPSGHQVVTVSDDQKVKVWSGEMGKAVSIMTPSANKKAEGEDTPVTVAFSPNGEDVAVGYHGGQVCIYDVATDVVRLERQYHNESVRTVHYDPTGSSIVCGSDDSTLTVFKANNGTKICSLVGHTKPVICAVYGIKYIVSTSHDFMVNIYPGKLHASKTRILKPLYVLVGHKGPVTCCSFNKDQTMLVTGSRDMSLRIWDIQQLKPQENSQTVKVIEHCHSDWINSCVWSNTGDFIVTASNDFNMKLWDVKTGKEKVKFTGHHSTVNHLAYKYGCIVSCASDGMVKVWTHKGTQIATFYGHTQRVNACDIFIRMRPSKVIKPVETSDWATMAEDEDWLEKHGDRKLNKTEVKIEGVLVVSASDDGTVRLWKPLEANELACYVGHTDKVLAASCTRENRIYTSGKDNCIKLWQSVSEADKQDVVPSHNAEVTCMTCTSDGEIIYTGSRDGYLMMWHCEPDVSKPVVSLTIKGHDKCIGGMTVACELSGTHSVITGSHDCHMTSWKLVTNQKRKQVLRKCDSVSTEHQITGVNWIPDTDRLVVSDWSNQITVWKVATETGKLNVSQIVKSSHSDWVIASSIFKHTDTTIIVSCGMDEKVIFFSAEGRLTNFGEVNEIHAEKITYSGYENLPKEKHNANWLTCLTVCDDTVWVGDIHGQVTSVKQGEPQNKRMIHGGELTACITIQNTLITASRDLTIKLWRTESMLQVGQYFCTSPVLCMRAVQKGDIVYLYCGDKLGRLTVYHWKV